MEKIVTSDISFFFKYRDDKGDDEGFKKFYIVKM